LRGPRGVEASGSPSGSSPAVAHVREQPRVAAPLWIGSRGSTDPDAAARAGKELLAALDVAEQRIRESYGDTPTPVLLGRLAEARKRLEQLTR
jgi:hypothetical protein